MQNDQKLIAQISDLSRNLNLMNQSLKKNTESIQSMLEASPSESENKPLKSEKSPIEKDLKDLSSVLSKMMAPESPFSKIAKAMEDSKSKTVDFTKSGEIKGAFQTGGVAKEEGNYVVGENGPEVVKLPKGTGIIPINTKDLIEGLKKVPELSGLLKDSDSVNVTGSIDSRDRSVVSSEGKKISLYKLIENYQEDIDINEYKPGDPTLKKLEEYIQALNNLDSESNKKIQDEFNIINQEKAKLAEKRGGAESFEEFKERENVFSEISKTLPPQEYTDLGIAKARLEAEKIVLSRKTDAAKSTSTPVEEPKPEASIVKTDLKKINTESKTGEEAKAPAKGITPEKAKSSGSPSEKKEPGFLSKLGKSASRVAEGVAEKTGIGGVLSVGKKILESKSQKAKSEEKSKSTGGPKESGSSEPSTMKKSVSTLSAPAPKPEPQKEQPKPEAPKPAPMTESKSSAPISTESKAPAGKSSADSGQKKTDKPENESVSNKDLDEIKSSLARIASLLEGPLSVSTIDNPFRPDSRRI